MNSFAPVNPADVDVVLPEHDGYPDELAKEDTRDVLIDVCRGAGATVRSFPPELWIEPSKWYEKARENDETCTWGMNYLDRYTNQGSGNGKRGTHECTVHSLTRIAEAAWNRQRGIIFRDGPRKGFRYPESAKSSVWLSVLSVYAEANPGQWGGANVRQVMEIACRRGFLPDKIQPRDYGFKHSLQGTAGAGGNNQSSGDWISLSRFPEGWPETASLLKPDEVIFPESWEQAMCLVLHKRLVGVGRDGHAIPWGQLMFSGKDLKSVAYPDSYEITRYDSLATIKRAWRGSFTISTMLAPHDWSNPAANPTVAA